MLKQRLITAIILIILVLLGIFYLPPMGFTLVAGLIVAFAAWECSQLLWPIKKTYRIAFLALLALLFMATQYVAAEPILIVSAFWWLLVPLFLVLYSKTQKQYFTDGVSGWLAGSLIFIPCLLGLIELRLRFGNWYLLYVLVLIWGADIGAYFVGKKFGKTPLAPIISPKKTVEGVYGGVLTAMIIAVIGGVLLHVTGIKWLYLMILIFVTTVWSIIGDLFESMLKRQVNVKDSGQILPGHGGVYDRIDSLTAAVPIFTLGLMLIQG